MESLNASSPDAHRNMLGNFIFPFVNEILFNQLNLKPNQVLAGKVTGMLISLQDHDLYMATESFEALLAKVKEAVNLIQASGLPL